MPERPLVAIPMGDPAGVGPEVTLKALLHDEVSSAARPLIIGDAGVLRKAADLLHLPVDIFAHHDPSEFSFTTPGAYLLDMENVDLERLQPGEISSMCAHASVAYVMKAADLALAGIVSAMATGPMNKAALQKAGYNFRGHTELLAERCNSEHVAMMLISPGRGERPHWLRVSHVTTHLALRQVPNALSESRILKTVELTHQALLRLGIREPRMALAALNPHASDGGLMGDEEARVLGPAIETARQLDYNIAGPIPADTVFLRHLQGEFDAVIALYHDQGHIPVKTHGFERAVNVTLGLPIIRTSVDHGTAFDIAWQGQAKEDSLVEAILLAARFAQKARN